MTKRIRMAAISFVLTTPAWSAPSSDSAPAARPEDVETIDGLMKALYEVVSGAEGQARDWNRYLSLFQPEARQVVIRGADPAKREAPFAAFTAAEYVGRVREQKPVALYERELRRRVDTFGQLAVVTSAYEVRSKPDGEAQYSAVYGLQLGNDGHRWWIQGVIWQKEGNGLKIEPGFLKDPPRVEKDG